MLYRVIASLPVIFSILVDAGSPEGAASKVETNDFTDGVVVDQGEWTVTNVELVEE